MALYQGEDIVLRVKGDDIVDFTNNEFWLMYYPKGKNSKSVTVGKNLFRNIDENVYEYVIPYNKTSDMQGAYNIEILIKDSETDRRAIYSQENAFYVEYSNIKDEELK